MVSMYIESKRIMFGKGSTFSGILLKETKELVIPQSCKAFSIEPSMGWLQDKGLQYYQYMK